MRKQAGFTLVEIAIVLVIIGLLLGGLLKGQEIITHARVNSLENEFNGIKTAIYTYQERYRALPGDDGRADRFTGISSQVGNSDGVIEGGFDSQTADDESRLFWLHLRNAELVAGTSSDQDQPINAFGGIIGASSSVLNIAGPFIGFTNIPQKVAVIIESRLDDGASDSGYIQALQNDGATAAADYATDTLYHLYFSL